MSKRIGLWLVKLIGVGLFVYIIMHIDRENLLIQIRDANVVLLALSFPVVFVIYFCKTHRFAALTTSVNARLPFLALWRMYNIGIFLASITPGKFGEMGRAAYLIAAGISSVAAFAIAIIDKLIDVIFICILATIAVGILFGWQWTLAGAFGIGVCGALLLLMRHASSFLKKHITKDTIAPIVLWTTAAWVAHFAWAILLARAVGIESSIPVLVAVLTLTGILSLFPIAPSGLGTRDAALVLLLAPYDIPAEQAVALALLMFISIILSGLLGGWYFLAGIQK